MRKKKGIIGTMTIKIDRKYYDRLSWPFIRETLHQAGLNQEWVRNIMACIENPRMILL